jgi:hypothetical protein
MFIHFFKIQNLNKTANKETFIQNKINEHAIKNDKIRQMLSNNDTLLKELLL